MVALTTPVLSRIYQEIEFDSFRAGNEHQRRAARYFRDLDVETNPFLFSKAGGRCIRPEPCAGPALAFMGSTALLNSSAEAERAFREELIGRPGHGMVGMLWERIKRRHSDAGDVPENVASRARIAYLSALQLDVLNDHFGDRGLDEIADCYARFACGELYLSTLSGVIDSDNPPRVSNGAPNSALAFCFAEFAFLAIEMGIDAKQWKRLLPTLVAVQEIYPLSCGDLDQHGRVVPIHAYRYGERYAFRPIDTSQREEIIARHRQLPYDSLPIVSHEHLRRAISTFGPAPSRSL